MAIRLPAGQIKWLLEEKLAETQKALDDDTAQWKKDIAEWRKTAPKAFAAAVAAWKEDDSYYLADKFNPPQEPKGPYTEPAKRLLRQVSLLEEKQPVTITQELERILFG